MPVSFRAFRHVRPTLARRCSEAIVQLPLLSLPFPSGIRGNVLLARFLVVKFTDHLLLYRQAMIYTLKRSELDRTLLASWVGAAIALQRPLGEAICQRVLGGAKLYSDEAPVQGKRLSRAVLMPMSNY